MDTKASFEQSWWRFGQRRSVLCGHGNELILEGPARWRLNPEQVTRRTPFEDGVISLKHIQRNGMLEEADSVTMSDDFNVCQSRVETQGQ